MARPLADKTAKKPSVGKTKAKPSTPKKPRGKPFVKGEPSANPAGRPKGSRNKLSEDFIAALANDFEAHGIGVVAKVREESPTQYLKLVADLVPKDLNLNHSATESFNNVWQLIGSGRLGAVL